jgi:hypothetical protein
MATIYIFSMLEGLKDATACFKALPKSGYPLFAMEAVSHQGMSNLRLSLRLGPRCHSTINPMRLLTESLFRHAEDLAGRPMGPFEVNYFYVQN